MAEQHQVIVYSRHGCHLCQEAEEILAELHSRANFICTVIQIDSDPALVARFANEIPVVYIDGRKAFKYRIDKKQFLRWIG